MRCIAVLVVFAAMGCSYPANPHTRFRYGPAEFFDSKDNDVEVVGLEVEPTNGTYRVERLTIRNNASDVRRANVEQIQAYTEQVKALTQMIGDLGQVVRAIAPYASPAVTATVPTPLGPVEISRTPTTRPADE